jgi:YVTN family beta-propeller protein
MTNTEDRLADALQAKAHSVREESLRPLAVPRRAPRRLARVLAPAAAAAAVALIAVFAVILPSARPVPLGASGPIAYVVGFTTPRTGPGASQGWITPVDTGTGVAGKPIGIGPEPIAIAVAPGGRTIYVLHQVPGELIPVSTATGKAGRPIGGSWTDQGVMAMAPNGRTIYVLSRAPAGVIPVDIATNTAGKPIRVGSIPTGIAITPDGRTAYVVSAGSGTVTPVDLATHTAGTPIKAGKSPLNIVITPNGKTAYVGYTQVSVSGRPSKSNAVIPVNTTTNTAGRPIWAGKDVSGLVLTPSGKTLYVVNTDSGTVTPVDTATNTAGKPIAIGSNPGLVAIAPDGRTAYALSGGILFLEGANPAGPGFVIPVDTATNTVGKAIRVTAPIGIAFTPDGKTAYVTSAPSRPGADGTVTPIDTAANTAGAPIAVKGQPQAIVIAPLGRDAATSS